MRQVKIYALIDVRTNEIRYIGKTIQTLNKRLCSHYSIRDDDYTHRANWLREMKGNNLKPIIQLIEEVPENKWEEREIYWIKYYSQIYKLTNTDKGGRGSHKIKTDVKLRKSISSKKMWESEEYRAKMKIKLKDCHSNEFKNHQSETMKIKWQDEDYKLKMSEMSKKIHPATNESKPVKYPKISELRLSQWQDENYRSERILAQSNRKPVICDNIEYVSIGEAARALNVHKPTIIKRIKSKHFPTYYYKKNGE